MSDWTPSPALVARMRAAIAPTMTLRQQFAAAVEVAGTVSRDRAYKIRRWVRDQGLPYVESAPAAARNRDYEHVVARCREQVWFVAKWIRATTGPSA